MRGARREIGPTDAVRRAKRAKSKSKRVARPSLARSTGRSMQFVLFVANCELNVNLSVSSMQLPRVTYHTSDLESAHTTQRYRLSRYLPYREHLPVGPYMSLNQFMYRYRVPVQNMCMARLPGRKSLQS